MRWNLNGDVVFILPVIASDASTSAVTQTGVALKIDYGLALAGLVNKSKGDLK